jgi:hypothetical protein
MVACPALTRRRSTERPDCWHIYYGDVQAGTIAMRVGNPHDTEPSTTPANCRAEHLSKFLLLFKNK